MWISWVESPFFEVIKMQISTHSKQQTTTHDDNSQDNQT